MREIKFRAWNGESMSEECNPFSDNSFWFGSSEESVFCNDAEGSQLIVMQYVCIDDKDGTPIYEGDILKTNFCCGVIEWFWNGWHINVKGQYYTLRTAKHSHEVIGNIHQNPTLIK